VKRGAREGNSVGMPGVPTLGPVQFSPLSPDPACTSVVVRHSWDSMVSSRGSCFIARSDSDTLRRLRSTPMTLTFTTSPGVGW
jgi:hypothetical protein